MTRAIGRTVAGLLLLALLAGCGVGVGDLNANPPKFYEEQVEITARVSRLQVVDGEAVLELADDEGRRILAVIPPATAETPTVGDWLKITGVFVADRRVGDTLLYDVVVAERVKRRGKPRRLIPR